LRRLLERVRGVLIRLLLGSELRVEKLRVGSSTVTIDGYSITLEKLTSDPSLAAGKLWFRSDLGLLSYSPDGTAVRRIPYGTINVDAHASRHKPGGADALFPADYSILPSADNTYDLGSSTYRWRNLYLGGALAVAGAASVGSLQVGGTTVIDSSRNLQNVNWISGVIRRDTTQEIFRCQSDTPQYIFFALRNAANTGAVDHVLAPRDATFGKIGDSSYPWYEVNSLYFRGDVVLPFGGDNTGGLGFPTQRWAYLYAVNKSAAFRHPLHNPEKYIVFRCVEGPKVTVEDWGVAELRGGVAFVKFSEEFAALISDVREYAVFLTPEGPCNGLYVSRKEPHGFEVRELGGGKSNVRFSWLVRAVRVGDEEAPVLEEPPPKFASREEEIKWYKEKWRALARTEEERLARIKRNIEKYRRLSGAESGY